MQYSGCNFNSMCHCVIDPNDGATRSIGCLSVPLYKFPSKSQYLIPFHVFSLLNLLYFLFHRWNLNYRFVNEICDITDIVSLNNSDKLPKRIISIYVRLDLLARFCGDYQYFLHQKLHAFYFPFCTLNPQNFFSKKLHFFSFTSDV